jgi:hypothetical protein
MFATPLERVAQSLHRERCRAGHGHSHPTRRRRSRSRGPHGAGPSTHMHGCASMRLLPAITPVFTRRFTTHTHSIPIAATAIGAGQPDARQLTPMTMPPWTRTLNGTRSTRAGCSDSPVATPSLAQAASSPTPSPRASRGHYGGQMSRMPRRLATSHARWS